MRVKLSDSSRREVEGGGAEEEEKGGEEKEEEEGGEEDASFPFSAIIILAISSLFLSSFSSSPRNTLTSSLFSPTNLSNFSRVALWYSSIPSDTHKALILKEKTSKFFPEKKIELFPPPDPLPVKVLSPILIDTR